MGYKLRLRELRKANKLTQTQLAKALGTTERVVGSWEREEVALNLDDACAICDVLRCTPNDLCGWYLSHPEDRPSAPPPLSAPEAEIVGCYRASTPEQRDKMSVYARERRAISETRASGSDGLSEGAA